MQVKCESNWESGPENMVPVHHIIVAISIPLGNQTMIAIMCKDGQPVC